MKIYIGPYTNWVGPYQIAALLEYVGVSEERCHEIGRKLDKTWLHDVCNWIEKKKKRKVKIRIDSYDTWGMDHTLAHIILPMLKQLKATKHGAPGDMPGFDQVGGYSNGSSQLAFEFYEKDNDKAWDAGHKQWDDIMDKMIWSFEQVLDDKWEEQYWLVKPEIDWTDYPEDEGKSTHPVRWKVQGVCDWEGHAKHQERIREGLRLFGEYYEGLWD